MVFNIDNKNSQNIKKILIIPNFGHYVLVYIYGSVYIKDIYLLVYFEEKNAYLFWNLLKNTFY